MKTVLAVVISLVAGSALAGDMKLSKYPKVFKGDEGVTVTVVPLVPESQNKALVQVTGIDHEIDDRVFLHDIQVQGKDQAFVITVDGTQRSRLRAGDGYWYKRYQLYLPDTIKSQSVWYDENASKAVKGAKLLAQYEKKDKAFQAKMAKFDRIGNEKRQEEELKKLDAEVKAECGTSVSTKIVWSTIDDKSLQKYSIYSYCGRVSDSLEYLCREKPEIKANAAKIKTVTCKFGKKLKLTRNGGDVSLEVDPETGNQDDFVTAYLKNEL